MNKEEKIFANACTIHLNDSFVPQFAQTYRPLIIKTAVEIADKALAPEPIYKAESFAKILECSKESATGWIVTDSMQHAVLHAALQGPRVQQEVVCIMLCRATDIKGP